VDEVVRIPSPLQRRGSGRESVTAEEKPSMSRRDVEKTYPRAAFIAKLRRLADALERDKRFTIQVASERISVPRDAAVSVEHEREGGVEQIELQVTWRVAGTQGPQRDPEPMK
jgi:amphi-Trp domain-containing protein